MNRSAFLARLRDGLTGLAQEDIDELISDYEAHFTEGAAAGRSDDDVARALGDPNRLARELRAEAGFRKWEAKPSPSNYLAAVVALIRLIAFDFIFLLPILLALGGILLGIAVLLIVINFSGMTLFGEAVSSGFAMVDFVARTLVSVGMISGGIAGGALFLITSEAILKLLASYARLHYRLLNQSEVLT
jgi:uncharacterized membrane protein